MTDDENKNDTMNAKSLITGRVNEGDEMPLPPEGAAPNPDEPHGPGRPADYGPMRRPGRANMLRGAMPPELRRVMGGPEEPEGMFSRQEQSQLKDILILMLAELSGSEIDKQIGEAFMNGQELNPGQLQHIIDETRRLKLPPSHQALLNKIFEKTTQR